VMPDGDNSFWVNWEASPGVAACAADSLLAEAAPAFCVPVSRYGDYVARDLVAQVDSAFRTRADRAHRGVAGLSMGGTGALTLALSFPEVFSAVAALSSVAAPFYLGPRPYLAPARQAHSLRDIEEEMGRPLDRVITPFAAFIKKRRGGRSKTARSSGLLRSPSGEAHR